MPTPHLPTFEHEAHALLPPPEWKSKIAETFAPDRKQILRGVVHDPRADRMGGVAGHAGLFGTAGDLALYAQALIQPEVDSDGDIIDKMTTPQTAAERHGGSVGWAGTLILRFSSNRGSLLPVGFVWTHRIYRNVDVG